MRRILLIVAVLGAGCGTIQAVSTMPNPARTTDRIEATQAYEIGPFKENHQYEATIATWTPKTVGVRLKLLDVDRCSQIDSFTFTLVDEHGSRFHLRPSGVPTQTTRTGRAGVTLKESVVSGAFEAEIGPDSKYLVIEQRPVPGYDCPAIDFRWNLQ
jgi:hypothetical protein